MASRHPRESSIFSQALTSCSLGRMFFTGACFSLVFAASEPSCYVQAGSWVDQNSCDLRCFDDGGTAIWEGALVEAMSQHGGDVELQIAALEVRDNVLPVWWCSVRRSRWSRINIEPLAQTISFNESLRSFRLWNRNDSGRCFPSRTPPFPIKFDHNNESRKPYQASSCSGLVHMSREWWKLPSCWPHNEIEVSLGACEINVQAELGYSRTSSRSKT